MRNVWRNIRAFFEYNWTKAKWILVKKTISSMPYDWSFLLDIERAKIIEMRNYFISSSETFDHENDIRWMNRCIALLNIIIENDEDSIPRVNLRNVDRFISPWAKGERKERMIKYLSEYPSDLRWAKAYNLYFEIRKFCTHNWWD